MKQIAFLLIFSLFFFCNCYRHKESQSVKTIVINPDDTVQNGFSEFFKMEKYIVLETSEKSVMQSIRKIYISNNKIFILTWGETQVLVFDINGKFLSKIGTAGSGPDEYSYVVDFSVSPDGDTVCFYDKGFNKLYYYDNQGSLLFTKELNADLETFIILPGGNIAGYSFLNYVQPLNDTIYQLWHFNKDGKVLNECLPVRKEVMGLSIGMASSFNSTASGNHFIPYTQNIVYKISENPFKITPVYKMDFKYRTIPGNILDLPRKEVRAALDKSYMLSGEFIGTKDLLFNIYSREQRKFMVAIYNLKKEKYILIDSDKLWDSANELPLEVNIQSTYFGEDRLIAISDPVTLLNNNCENAQSIGYGLKRRIKETDNPILVLYKEK